MTTTSTRFRLEDLVKLPIFLLPTASWSGDELAYYSNHSGSMELWVVDIASGEHRQVSNGQIPKALRVAFAWDRTGAAIVFARDTDGDEQHNIWLLDLQSQEATQLTDTPGVQEVPVEVAPDDEQISFLSTRGGQLNLYSMRRDGSDVRALTDFTNPVFFGGSWSPDGRYLTAAVNETENLQTMDIYLVNADGSGARRLFSTGEGTKDFATAWSHDGRSLAITSDASGVNRTGILDIETGEVRWLGAEGVDETSGTFSPDGRSLVAARNRDARLQLVIYDVETGGERLPVLPEGGSLNAFSPIDFVLGGAAITLSYSTDATRPALLLHDLTSGETRTLIEPEYGPIDPAAFAVADDVYYPSFDGLQIHALLYRPHDIDAGRQVPAIVLPHGGPTGQYFHGFDPYVQFLVNEGYAVLEPNIRGSTGYGVEFRDMALEDWGGADLQDVVAGREYLASQPFIAPDRVGVFGISYGGFMTYIAMTKAPEYWKAGVAWVGITDLLAMYEESMPHFKYFLRNQMGDPEKNADLWRDRSAVNFAQQMQGTLLIVHGINDPRCPVSQARIFRDRLLELGKVEGQDFEYVELSDEGHASTDQEQRLRAFTLVADYFGRNL